MSPESIVIDGLNGSVLTPRVVDALRQSMITAVNLTAVQIGADLIGALHDLTCTLHVVEQTGSGLSLIRSSADIRRAKAESRTGIILGMQDTEAIGRDLSLVRVLKEMGVRIIQITHNRQCYAGTGCVEPDSGLTAFGRRLIDEMNRLGIVVDVSHCGPRTTLDAIRHSAVPVVATHANPSTISPSVRNKSDEIIVELAARGGVLGIAAWSPIVARDKQRRPTLADVVACIDHAVRLVGVAHVGIGSDICDDLTPTPSAWEAVYGPKGSYPEVSGGLGDWYGFDTCMAEGLSAPSDFVNLERALLDSGYSVEATRQILGLNFLRVFERSW